MPQETMLYEPQVRGTFQDLRTAILVAVVRQFPVRAGAQRGETQIFTKTYS